MLKMPTNANIGHLKFTAEFTYYAHAKAEVVFVLFFLFLTLHFLNRRDMSMPDVAEHHRLTIAFKNGSHHVSQETL